MSIRRALINLTFIAVSAHAAAVKNYVDYALDYKPFEEMRDQVEKKLNTKLKNRGEAHITIITPPEFAILSQKIEPAKIQEISNRYLQKKPAYEIVCIGSGSATLNGKLEKTYFVVVKSPDLLQLRQLLAAEAKTTKEEFDPNLFFPHVTLGFTARDLYYEDGIFKNESSCLK